MFSTLRTRFHPTPLLGTPQVVPIPMVTAWGVAGRDGHAIVESLVLRVLIASYRALEAWHASDMLCFWARIHSAVISLNEQTAQYILLVMLTAL